MGEMWNSRVRNVEPGGAEKVSSLRAMIHKIRPGKREGYWRSKGGGVRLD